MIKTITRIRRSSIHPNDPNMNASSDSYRWGMGKMVIIAGPFSLESGNRQLFPRASIPCSSPVGPCRYFDPVREHDRIDHFAAIEAAPAIERAAAGIVAEIDKRISNHESITTLAAHDHPPSGPLDFR
jgi:hypothetical protein